MTAETGEAANFSINPVRVFFDGTSKTSTVTVKNESDEEITLQLKAYKWQQDAEGKDVYFPTTDIVYFPKIAKIKGSEEKIIRLGAEMPRDKLEKTYRLYLEEIPAPSAAETTTVKIVMKVGVPIFISPVDVEPKGSIEKAEVSDGNLDLVVKNEGNIHFIIKAIRIAGTDDSGGEIYKTDLGGKYLLGGNSKDFRFQLPREECHKLKALNIDIDTDRLSLGKKLDLDRKKCPL
ncbi:MAG: molecular chaperone [Nitrospirae bacterium]|nr:molecular chaperone [Nitrospirota bacterium]